MNFAIIVKVSKVWKYPILNFFPHNSTSRIFTWKHKKLDFFFCSDSFYTYQTKLLLLTDYCYYYFLGSAWPWTFPCFTTKSWIPLIALVDWPRQPSTMPLPNSIPCPRKATKIRHWSCNCWETTSHSGRRTCKPKV